VRTFLIAEASDHCCCDVQGRSALGSRDVSEGHFDLRTVDNVRQRVTQPMQETGANLIARGFEQVTDAQIAAFPVQTSNLRMDRTLIASTIRQATRLQVLVEALQRTQRMLDEADQQRYGDEFAPSLKGASGQDISALRRADDAAHRPRIGALMQRLVSELRANYGDEPASQALARVFQEHVIVEESVLRAREGQEWSAASLPSPDDGEDADRCKHGQGQRGSVANVSATCHPENPFPLMVNVQSEPNTTDDAALLAAALPELAKRSDVDELHTDGGCHSPQVDDLMQTPHVRQVQTAIRGLQPTEGKVGLEDMTWQTNADNGQPECVTCPGGQRAEVVGGRTEGRSVATCDASVCADCPLREQCPTQPLVRRAGNVVRFSQRAVNVAFRRQRCAEERVAERHLRPAVEATIRAITHPFRNGKAPVRGRLRVSMLRIGSAAMTNVRQIDRYQRSQEAAGQAEEGSQKASGNAWNRPVRSSCASLWTRLRALLCPMPLVQPAWACSR
jgi:hypothetical protein